jgi:hypothetical protein
MTANPYSPSQAGERGSRLIRKKVPLSISNGEGDVRGEVRWTKSRQGAQRKKGQAGQTPFSRSSPRALRPGGKNAFSPKREAHSSVVKALPAAGGLCYNAPTLGEWPSGKAAAFGAAIRRFESCLPSLPPKATAGTARSLFFMRVLLARPDRPGGAFIHIRFIYF